MVEKPLAFGVENVQRIEALANRYGIHVLTNYETTWYLSGYAAFEFVCGDKAIGPIRKVVVRDGYFGPKEVGVAAESLSWLTDPTQNGGGALIDFACYGANIMTWLMGGAAPMTVTAVTQQLKSDPAYARVDDEATINSHLSGRASDHSRLLELARPPQRFGDLRHARLRFHAGRQERFHLPARAAHRRSHHSGRIAGALLRRLRLPRGCRSRRSETIGQRPLVSKKQRHCGAYSRRSAALRAGQADN
jgi:hypothetical protein